jgi:hypothetical protein
LSTRELVIAAEVALSSRSYIPLLYGWLINTGKNLIVKWRGKPVFIRHRTADEIDEANQVDVKTLRDPQADEDRVQRPEW